MVAGYVAHECTARVGKQELAAGSWGRGEWGLSTEAQIPTDGQENHFLRSAWVYSVSLKSAA
jgi:hypothetical protein